MKEAKFEVLFLEELEDLYDAEQQIVEALPKMIKAASSEELESAFLEHLEQTREHVRRLERVFEAMGEQPGNRTCEGMQALLQEGEKPVREMKKSPVLAMAEMLGQADAAEILQETLDEEQATDERLSEIAEAIMTGDEMEEEAEEEPEEEEITSE